MRCYTGSFKIQGASIRSDLGPRGLGAHYKL